MPHALRSAPAAPFLLPAESRSVPATEGASVTEMTARRSAENAKVLYLTCVLLYQRYAFAPTPLRYCTSAISALYLPYSLSWMASLTSTTSSSSLSGLARPSLLTPAHGVIGGPTFIGVTAA